MKTFVIGDIHGAHAALLQCLERSGFDKDNDRLITLGDICDGWPYVAECVDELLTIENRIDIMGNHDEWFLDWIRTGIHPDRWKQGGAGTRKSYKRKLAAELERFFDKEFFGATGLYTHNIPDEHKDFFYHQRLYFVDESNNLFVHAGIRRQVLLCDQFSSTLLWDRELYEDAIIASRTKTKLRFIQQFANVFIGHTNTLRHNRNVLRQDDHYAPVFADRVINIDTGSGFSGKLTIMEVETKQYWQSDIVTDLYPDEEGR